MAGLVVIILLGLATIAALYFLVAWWRRRIGREEEPIIELERLVNCVACGSLIPEGVRLCAFCGKEQARAVSGE